MVLHLRKYKVKWFMAQQSSIDDEIIADWIADVHISIQIQE